MSERSFEGRLSTCVREAKSSFQTEGMIDHGLRS